MCSRELATGQYLRPELILSVQQPLDIAIISRNWQQQFDAVVPPAVSLGLSGSGKLGQKLAITSLWPA
jgi:hypothetical protein